MKQLITEFKNGELIRLCIIDLDKLHETFMREATASQDKKFICESDKT